MKTTAARLRASLESMINQLASIVREVPIEHFHHKHESVIVIAPQYGWSILSAKQTAKLHSIKRDYKEWIDLVHSIFRHAPMDVNANLKKADSRFRNWLEFGSNWSLKPNADTNEESFRKDASDLLRLLDILDSTGNDEIIVIPDTNSIVEHLDPVSYRQVAENDSFTILLLPTVLSELDELKNLHRNQSFRDKAKKAVVRIKGWRTQGSLRDGVTINRTITVRAFASEPDMSKSLSWLDPRVSDDRIIASAIEVMANNPSSRVVLVTGDINLLNKAEAAGIDNAEI